jgi:hypothetical protein
MLWVGFLPGLDFGEEVVCFKVFLKNNNNKTNNICEHKKTLKHSSNIE